MAIAVTVFVGVCVLCGVLTVAASIRSSQISQRRIVAQRGPEQQPCKRVETLSADAWREEYAAAMRLRDGMGRR
jgi:hypothetical protein